MPSAASLKVLTDNAALMSPALLSTVDVKLLKAAQIRGDFPTSLSLLARIQTALAVEHPDLEEIAAMICVDPLLTLRVISIANHDYYSKGEPALSVAAAVHQISLGKAKEVLQNLAEAKNFNALYLGRAVSFTMLQQSILVSLIARGLASIMKLGGALAEQAYTTAVLSNVGPLLLAFYRPNIYSGLCLDCMDDRSLFERVFRKVMQKSTGEFALAVARALSLPERYGQLAEKLHALIAGTAAPTADDLTKIGVAVKSANLLAHEICYFTGIQGMQSLISELASAVPCDPEELENLIGLVPDIYLEHCRTLALKPLRLPEYLLWFAPVEVGSQPVRWRLALPGINERINPFLYELRACFKTRAAAGDFPHLPQAVYCTLSALIKGLNFDRAILFQVDEAGRFLQPLFCHGVKLFQPEKLRRFIADPDHEAMPDVRAFLQKQTVFTGDPVFRDGWPFVSFPVIHRDRVLGVFYADKVKRPDSDALETQEQISCVALAEEWHDIPADFR